MLSTNSLINQLKSDFPQYNFVKSDDFSWSHNDQTIKYDDNNNDCHPLLLHELAHAILCHAEYGRDIELIAMERDAWDRARQLANDYGIKADDDFIQSNLDSYRDWMHDRSTCPECKANGLQIKNKVYKCPVCNHQWQVNEARTCQLRRYSIPNKQKHAI